MTEEERKLLEKQCAFADRLTAMQSFVDQQNVNELIGGENYYATEFSFDIEPRIVGFGLDGFMFEIVADKIELYNNPDDIVFEQDVYDVTEMSSEQMFQMIMELKKEGGR